MNFKRASSAQAWLSPWDDSTWFSSALSSHRLGPIRLCYLRWRFLVLETTLRQARWVVSTTSGTQRMQVTPRTRKSQSERVGTPRH